MLLSPPLSSFGWKRGSWNRRTRHLPLATCHLPLATRHLPLATCHLPLATCHLPLATRHSSPARLALGKFLAASQFIPQFSKSTAFFPQRRYKTSGSPFPLFHRMEERARERRFIDSFTWQTCRRLGGFRNQQFRTRWHESMILLFPYHFHPRCASI